MLRSCEVLRQAPLSLLLTVIVFLTTDLCVSKCLEHCKHPIELPNSMFVTFNYNIYVLNATSSTDWPTQLAWLSYIPWTRSTDTRKKQILEVSEKSTYVQWSYLVEVVSIVHRTCMTQWKKLMESWVNIGTGSLYRGEPCAETVKKLLFRFFRKIRFHSENVIKTKTGTG